MAAPSKLLLKLSCKLFPDPDEQRAFVDALTTPRPYPVALVWLRPRPAELPFPVLPPLPWQPSWVDRVDPAHRPGGHPLHASGHYYCLDSASVFEAAVLGAIPAPVESVLDLCAAPGGKTLLARCALGPRWLWCNEVVRQRERILIANLRRCGVTEARVFGRSVETLAPLLAHQAEVVMVDAPCSGQSLLAKGNKAPGCFHPVTTGKNASRQRRILAQAVTTLRQGGYLAYMTCTFAPDENERVLQWLLKTYPQLEAVTVPALQAHQSPLTPVPCYRLWPHSGLGAGGFTALLRNHAPGYAPIDEAALAAASLEIYGSPTPDNDLGDGSEHGLEDSPAHG